MRYLALFLLLFPAVAIAQKPDRDRRDLWMLKWNPLTLWGYSSIQLGGEYFFSSNKSLHLELGYITPLFPEAALSYSDIHGFRFKVNPRYYFRKLFFGPELHCSAVDYQELRDYASTFTPDGHGGFYPDDPRSYNIDVKQNAVCLNLLAGVQFLRKKRIGVEFFGGVGARYVTTVFYNEPVGLTEAVVVSDVGPGPLMLKYPGDKTKLNICLGMRFIFRMSPSGRISR